MEKIVFKKSWIERMDNMNRWTRHRCIIALYELLYFGRITPPGLRGGPEVLQFIRSIAKEVAADTERRERIQKRREEKRLSPSVKPVNRNCKSNKKLNNLQLKCRNPNHNNKHRIPNPFSNQSTIPLIPKCSSSKAS